MLFFFQLSFIWSHHLKESRIIRLRIKKNGTCSALRLWSRLMRVKRTSWGSPETMTQKEKEIRWRAKPPAPPLPKRTSRCRNGTSSQIRRLHTGVQYRVGQRGSWANSSLLERSLYKAQEKELPCPFFYQWVYSCFLWFAQPKNMHVYHMALMNFIYIALC